MVAPFSYGEEAVRAVTLAFKHGGRRDLAAPLARSMVRALRASEGAREVAGSTGGRRARSIGTVGPGPFDLLVPVPAHASRRIERGHDPPRILARELELAGVGRAAPVLRRVRATPAQGSAGAPGRRSNVRGAFRFSGRDLGGAEVWLVDDVLTSGATADACARALRGAGAGRVHVLVLARA